MLPPNWTSFDGRITHWAGRQYKVKIKRFAESLHVFLSIIQYLMHLAFMVVYDIVRIPD